MNALNREREPEASMSALHSDDHTATGWDPFEVWQRFFQQPRALHDAQQRKTRYSLVTDLSAARIRLRVNPIIICSTPAR